MHLSIKLIKTVSLACSLALCRVMSWYVNLLLLDFRKTHLSRPLYMATNSYCVGHVDMRNQFIYQIYIYAQAQGLFDSTSLSRLQHFYI